MSLLIAIPVFAVVFLVGIIAFAGKPAKDALDEIQQEDAK
jgi:hypothetical protein